MSQSLLKIKNKIFSKPFIIQFLKFAIVGAIGTLVNLGLLYIFTEIFNFYYIISEIIAFTVSVINNYLLNKIWTFKEELKQEIVQKYAKYFVISVISLIVNLTILFILVEHFDYWYILAELFAIACSFVVNYLGNVLWTFRDQNKIVQNQDLEQ